MEFSVTQIAAIIGGNIDGDGNTKINNVGSIEDATPGCITFLSNPKYEPHIYTTEASAVIVSRTFSPKKSVSAILISVEDPYLAFTQLLEEYNRMVSLSKQGVEEPAYLGKDVTLGQHLYRGAFSYIGDNCVIGNHVKIYPHAYVGDGVTIGDNTVVYAGAKLYAHTAVGSHCTIHAGAVIGSDGFGFAPMADGSYRPIPQLGNVVLKNHVSIGANATVDCATMKSTIIGTGTKLDNLVHVAHNVEIGDHVVMAAQAGVSGSSTVGNYVQIGGQVGISWHIHIADKALIGAQSGLGHNVKEGEKLLGSPAFEIKSHIKSHVLFKRLPELNERIKQLEEKTLNLPTTKEK